MKKEKLFTRKEVKVKCYFHGISDAGTCLLFKLYILEHMNLMRSWRHSVHQGKSKFGRLGGGKSCSVVYSSARSSRC